MTTTDLPAMTRFAVRAEPGFAAIVMETDPEPVPVAGESLIQDGAVLVAQAQPAMVVTAVTAVSPEAGAETVAGDTV